ncbi:hypothetical protein DB346_24120 [Verrucomicrobia bacterium LW23]|nr:hypothetical protein DB346_24120 [Verrucomicrobia bacterium LW23]
MKVLNLLLLDVGNTSTKAAVCSIEYQKSGNTPSPITRPQQGSNLRILDRVETAHASEEWLRSCAAKACGLGPATAATRSIAIAFCSVVPQVSALIHDTFEASALWQVTATEDVGWDFRYPDSANLGADRLCAATGAYALLRREDNPPSVHSGPFIAIDCGTATTFNIVDHNDIFIGGVIAPGLDMFLGYMHEKTAQLPSLTPADIHFTYGSNTKDSMLAGAMHGYSGMVATIVDKIEKELAKSITGVQPAIAGSFTDKHIQTDSESLSASTYRIRVVTTGGNAQYLDAALTERSFNMPLLNMEGLLFIALHGLRTGKLRA